MDAFEALKEMIREKYGYEPEFEKQAEKEPTPNKGKTSGYRKRGIGWTRASHEEPKYRRKMRQASQKQLRAWRRRHGR